jgi:hypothetical protein
MYKIFDWHLSKEKLYHKKKIEILGLDEPHPSSGF